LAPQATRQSSACLLAFGLNPAMVDIRESISPLADLLLVCVLYANLCSCQEHGFIFLVTHSEIKMAHEWRGIPDTYAALGAV
jgi:hypothetical protein